MERTIRSYQSILATFKFSEPSNFHEKFAQERFHKKFEVPNERAETRLKRHALIRWWLIDRRLDEVGKNRYMPHWYKARRFLHDLLSNYSARDITRSDIRWPVGAEFDRFPGRSLEARLSRRSAWSCTLENFDEFFRTVRLHHGLKIAVKKRFNRNYSSRELRAVNKKLYKQSKIDNFFPIDVWSTADRVLYLKIAHVTQRCYGSRFSTVPKNNSKRRPINIEPFCNLVTQSQVGTFIRNILKKELSYELNDIAALHRNRISGEIATIDESDASDSISIELCRFLFPKWFFNQLMRRRSEMVLLPEYGYYIPKKLSSMGNGFTFEVLTLINLALCRSFDNDSTVFGDDIICSNDVAFDVVEHLESVGFSVNREKTFVNSEFRESCGANYYHGYIESYDFKYPTTIGDCVSICNKLARLSRIYPSFRPLYQSIVRSTSVALRGYYDPSFLEKEYKDLFNSEWRLYQRTLDLPSFFVMPKGILGKACVKVPRRFVNAARDYQVSLLTLVYEFRNKSDLRSQTSVSLRSSQWAKYMMYLAAGRRTPDHLSSGRWTRVLRGVTTCQRALSDPKFEPGTT